MIGKIFSVNTDIVYRREESLNLFEGKKNLIRWCLVGYSRNKSSCLVYHQDKVFYQICCPQVNMNDTHEVIVLNKVEDLVRTECYNKVVEYSNRKHHA